MESPEKQKRFIWSPSSLRLLPSAYNADVPLASSCALTKSSGGFRPSLRGWYVWWMTSRFMFVRWASPSLAYLCLTATLQASIRQHSTVHVSKGPSRNVQSWWFFVIITRITIVIPEMAEVFFPIVRNWNAVGWIRTYCCGEIGMSGLSGCSFWLSPAA